MPRNIMYHQFFFFWEEFSLIKFDPFFLGTKGEVLSIQTNNLRGYIICYIVLSKSANLINTTEILFIHKIQARLVYKNSIQLQIFQLVHQLLY